MSTVPTAAVEPTSSPELLSRTIGRRVVSGADASTLGEVKALLMDERGQQIVALHVSGRARHAETLAWADLGAFGPDAVIARPGAQLQAAADEQQEDEIRGRVTILGGKVLGTDGFERGRVADVTFDTTSGWLLSLTVQTKNKSPMNVPAHTIRSLGPYCWVVDASVPFS